MANPKTTIKPNEIYKIGILRKDCDEFDPQLHWRKTPITMTGSDLKIRGIKKFEDVYNTNPFKFDDNSSVVIYLVDPETQSLRYLHSGFIQNSFQPLNNTLSDNFEYAIPNNNHYSHNNDSSEAIETYKSLTYKLQQENEELKERIEYLIEQLTSKKEELAQISLRQSIREEIEEKLAKEISSQNKSSGLDGVIETVTGLAPLANLLMGFLGNGNGQQKQLSLPQSAPRQSTIPKPVFNNIEEEL